MEAFLAELDEVEYGLDCFDAKEKDEILMDVCKGFTYDGIDDDDDRMEAFLAELDEVFDCPPQQPAVHKCGNNGRGKSLLLLHRHHNKNLDGGNGDHVDHEKALREEETKEVGMEFDEAHNGVFGEEEEEASFDHEKALCKEETKEVWKAFDHEKAHKVVFGEEAEEANKLRTSQLRAKLEHTKAKLRDDYAKTLPTRHVKVLQIDQIPDFKPPKSTFAHQPMKKNASTAVPVRPLKRKLEKEARAICKRAKTTLFKTPLKKKPEKEARAICKREKTTTLKRR